MKKSTGKKRKKEIEEPMLVCPRCGCSTSGILFGNGDIECIDEKGCGWRGSKSEAKTEEDFEDENS